MNIPDKGHYIYDYLGKEPGTFMQVGIPTELAVTILKSIGKHTINKGFVRINTDYRDRSLYLYQCDFEYYLITVTH